MRSRHHAGRLGVRVHGQHVPAKLRDDGRPTPHIRATKGMGQRVCPCEGLLEADQGLLRYPSNQRVCAAFAAGHPQLVDHPAPGARCGSGVARAMPASSCRRAAGKARAATTYSPWHSGRGPQGRGHRRVAPGPTTSPRARGQSVTAAGQYKTATDRTGPGPARASRPSADTTRGPGCRCARPRARRALWSSAVPHRGRGAVSRRAGSRGRLGQVGHQGQRMLQRGGRFPVGIALPRRVRHHPQVRDGTRHAAPLQSDTRARPPRHVAASRRPPPCARRGAGAAWPRRPGAAARSTPHGRAHGQRRSVARGCRRAAPAADPTSRPGCCCRASVSHSTSTSSGAWSAAAAQTLAAKHCARHARDL